MGCKHRTQMLVAGLMLLAGCSPASSPQNERAARPTAAFSDPAIAYPAGLAEAVRQCCSDFHLPQQDEIQGAWQDSDGEGSVPFLIQGDFNGDGAQDAAVLLVAEDRAGVALAVFHRAAQGYHLAHRRPIARVDDLEVSAHHEIVLQLIRKNEEWAPEGGDVPMDYAHAHDAIGFETRKADAQGLVIAYKHLLYWDGKQYAEY